jgi:hypothetical protein
VSQSVWHRGLENFSNQHPLFFVIQGKKAMLLSQEHSQHFNTKGWTIVPYDHALRKWAKSVQPVAENLIRDSELSERWLRCDGTWFAGVNVLPNDKRGAIEAHDVPPLPQTEFCDILSSFLGIGDISWDFGQVSACYPGYPRISADETIASFNFRKNRDNAHVDGLLKDEKTGARYPGEFHAFVVGIPLDTYPQGSSPMVVWDGSHRIIQKYMQDTLAEIPMKDWSEIDITQGYQQKRKECFEQLPRTEISVPQGSAYILHHMALHGIAPWVAPEGAPPRIIVYFRPDLNILTDDENIKKNWWLRHDTVSAL